MFAPKASLRGGEAQQLFPADVQTIPEFVVVDLQIMTSHSGNSEKGYGIKLQRVSLNPTTLYSYLTKQSLLAIPGSYLESVEDAVGKSRASQFVANQLEVKNTSFFSKVPPNAFISSTPVCDGLYRLVGHSLTLFLPLSLSIDACLTMRFFLSLWLSLSHSLSVSLCLCLCLCLCL